jgi:hypothetical protein
MDPQPAENDRNLHVLNILPLTALRTIDLGGKKNFGPLFSRFCAQERSFFCTYKASRPGSSVMPLLLLNLAGCTDVDLDLVAEMKHERATRR